MSFSESFSGPLKIIIVEDHAIVRHAVALTLTGLGPTVTCDQVGDAAGAIRLLEQDPNYDLILVDLMLPEMNGFAFLGILAKRFPGVPAMVVSALDDSESVQRAMRAGANGFVSKTASSDEILEAVTIVLSGGVAKPKTASNGAARSVRQSKVKSIDLGQTFGLTPAQVRILELLSQGLQNKEIAEKLDLQHGTVRVHVSAIFKAMGVSNRANALLALSRAGLKV